MKKSNIKVIEVLSLILISMIILFPAVGVQAKVSSGHSTSHSTSNNSSSEGNSSSEESSTSRSNVSHPFYRDRSNNINSNNSDLTNEPLAFKIIGLIILIIIGIYIYFKVIRKKIKNKI